MNGEALGQMLIIDASALHEVVTNTDVGRLVKERISAESELAAPHVIDVEVMGVIRRDRMLGWLDATAATQAIDDLRNWPGDRFGHRALLHRA